MPKFDASLSSSSLSSSFSSSAASSMLLPAAPPSNSSQSDIITSDQSGSSLSPASSKSHLPAQSLSFAPRSSSLAVLMGQSHNRAYAPPLVTTSPNSDPKPTIAAGSKLKRAFAGRRKRSEDLPTLSLETSGLASKGKEREPSVATGDAQSPTRHPVSPRQLSLQLASHVFSSKKRSLSSGSSPQSEGPSSSPPVSPPRPAVLQAGRRQHGPISAEHWTDQRGSVLINSPSISAALDFMRNGEEQREKDTQDRVELKDAWRKSDSTMSHHTIRPGVTLGSRASRPVSMAESLQSTHTIVPNKRLSALVTEAEFSMPEEEAEDYPQSLPPLPRSRLSPSPSVKSKNRRSLSLKIGSSTTLNTKTFEPSANDAKTHAYTPRSVSDMVHVSPTAAARDTPTLTRTAATGIISPSNSGGSSHSAGSHIKGRLAAWSALSHSHTSSSVSSAEPPSRQVPPMNPLRVSHVPPTQPPAPHPSLRQTAISITSSFGPAAGLAKRAVEKMGRAWGGLGSSSSSSGYTSSSSSGTAPSSYSGGRNFREPAERGLLHANPPHSSKGKRRRTPDAPSGSWSIQSSATSSSVSDSDAFMTPDGPILGQRLRGPMRFAIGGAGVAGGLVFGRDLRTCVRETAVDVRSSFDQKLPEANFSEQGSTSRATVIHADAEAANPIRQLEKRRLPALVVRCTQHLLTWGVQEEGLFRVTGRPSHVAKLRTEFDTGADFDMLGCAPVDLDPHAVASIFKAYLRELPEPILTHNLLPFFDAALTAESNMVQSHESPSMPPPSGPRVVGLPSGPKGGSPHIMRKPPSLSTLAMPNFSGMPPPSERLLNALASLIARLPVENRDLVRTVTELIRATASQSKETKMPLSNLLLVLCPSLNMSPPLLRVLCEGTGIWDGPPKSLPADIVFDIRRESRVPDEDESVDGGGEMAEDGGVVAVTGTEVSQSQEQHSVVQPELVAAVAKLDVFSVPKKRSLESRGDLVRNKSLTGPRPQPAGRRAMPAVFLQSDNDASSFLAPELSIEHRRTTSETSSITDDSSYVSTSEGPSNVFPCPVSSAFFERHKPPPLSSSSDSLTTPSTLSEEPSFTHVDMPDDPYSKSLPLLPPRSPVIADATDLPLPVTPPQTVANEPIQFPVLASPPTTPASRRRSIPFLSISPSSPEADDGSPSGSPSSIPRRLKRPSLHLLFSKRSASPIFPGRATSSSSPYFQSNSSESTPISATSMVTAPQSSSYSLPPKLDTTIDSTPLRLSLTMNDDEDVILVERHEKNSQPGSSGSHQTITRGASFRTSASSAPPSSIPFETPIADHFRSASVLSFTSPSDEQPTQPLKRYQISVATSSTTSVDRLGVVLSDSEDSVGDDWAQSVLIAADADVGLKEGRR